MVKYSVIMLLEEKREEFYEFLVMLHHAFSSLGTTFELLLISNGTGGFVRSHLDKEKVYFLNLKVLEFSNQTSNAVCLKSALAECEGEILVVCGSYQQITHDSFLNLLASLDSQVDIVCPWRRKRIDSTLSTIQSRIFNAIVRKVTGTDIHDLSCTVRVLRRRVLEETELYGDMYRFLPVVAARKGFVTREVECAHYQERGKSGLYSFREYTARMADILALYFTTSFSRKPLRFFGAKGMLFFGVGLLLFAGILLRKLIAADPLGDSPLLILSIIAMVIGVQISSVGLLGEILAFTYGRQKKEYVIEKTLQ
jgi:hypothetical protein